MCWHGPGRDSHVRFPSHPPWHLAMPCTSAATMSLETGSLGLPSILKVRPSSSTTDFHHCRAKNSIQGTFVATVPKELTATVGRPPTWSRCRRSHRCDHRVPSCYRGRRSGINPNASHSLRELELSSPVAEAGDAVPTTHRPKPTSRPLWRPTPGNLDDRSPLHLPSPMRDSHDTIKRLCILETLIFACNGMAAHSPDVQTSTGLFEFRLLPRFLRHPPRFLALLELCSAS